MKLDRSKLIKARPRKEMLNIDMELVMKLRDECYTTISIADAMGISISTLNNRISEYKQDKIKQDN